jgi:hypothetical protein
MSTEVAPTPRAPQAMGDIDRAALRSLALVAFAALAFDSSTCAAPTVGVAQAAGRVVGDAAGLSGSLPGYPKWLSEHRLVLLVADDPD